MCFKFWQLVHASGCPYRCAYCFLQTTTFFRVNKSALMGLVYENWEQMLDEVKAWLSSPTPRMLIVGELQDGLAFESCLQGRDGQVADRAPGPSVRRTGPASTDLPDQEHGNRARTEAAGDAPGRVLVVGQCGIRGPTLGTGRTAPNRRFDAAARMQDAGWRIRFRLDPMIPYDNGDGGWREGYAAAIRRINSLGPEMVTIGALRASTMGLASAACKNGRPTDLFAYLSEKDPSGFKYRLPFASQVEMYRFAIEQLDGSRITPALCKDVPVRDRAT